MLVFVLLLIIVISTSHSCRGNRGGSDTDSGSGSDTNKSPTGSGGAVLPSGDDTSDVETSAVPSDFVIFIDPGHGPGDVGSSSEYLGEYKERDMTLEVAKEIVRILCDQGYNAKLTHDGVNIPYDPNDSGTFYVDERCDYVNSNNVGLFVSIHCDSYDDEDVYGTRVYYCDDESGDSYAYTENARALTDMLAQAIDSTFPDAKKTTKRGYEPNESYYVTRHVDAPAALIEIGFITNQNDAANILDPEWRAKMSDGIAKGIMTFADGYMRTSDQS